MGTYKLKKACFLMALAGSVVVLDDEQAHLVRAFTSPYEDAPPVTVQEPTETVQEPTETAQESTKTVQEPPATVMKTEYGMMTLKTLKEIATERNIQVSSTITKQELINLLGE